MRLTHLCEYGDKRKNKEPMLKIRNKLFDYENIEEKHSVLSLKDLDNKLTALEIIKEKEMLSVFQDIKGKYFIVFNDTSIEISQEEFDLLKEVLL